MRVSTKFFLGSFFLFSFACEDILEEDISGDMVQISYPFNNAVIESNIVSFQWGALGGADSYRIQIYRDNAAMALDSLVSSTNFSYPLLGGHYQWRVRGENSAYESQYSFPAAFTVLESSDLTNQQVILASPANGLYTNSPSLTCTWQALAAAQSYSFQLFNVTSGQILVVDEDEIAGTSILLNNASLLQESEYQWKVKARNDDSETAVFSSRSFYIDRTVPNQPQLASPANDTDQMLSQPISFAWNSSPDSGTIQSPLRYVIEFSNTASFSTVLQSSTVNSASFEESFTSDGTYFWRVKAVDKAGNNGNYSNPFKFVIE